MFMLVIGAFGIVMRTGTVDNGILALIRHTRGNEVLFIRCYLSSFRWGTPYLAWAKKAVAFLVIAPLMVRLGYDSITTVTVTYIATQIGFASSWMNPFCVVVAGDCRRAGTFRLRRLAYYCGLDCRHADWAGFYAGLRLTREIRCFPASTNPIAISANSRMKSSSALSPSVTGWYCWS